MGSSDGNDDDSTTSEKKKKKFDAGYSKESHSELQVMEAGVVAITQLVSDVKKRVEGLDQSVIPEIRHELKCQNDVISTFKKSLDAILGVVKLQPKPNVPGRLVLEETTEMEKAEAARRDARRLEHQSVLEYLWSDIVEQDAFLARTHLQMVRDEMETKLSHDGRRAEAEILIQEMLDKFRSELEVDYANKIKEAKERIRDEAHVAAWVRLEEELDKRKKELEEQKFYELEEEKRRLIDMFRLDFEGYLQRTVDLQTHLLQLLSERNNAAKDFMALQKDYKRFIDIEKGPDQWQHILEMRDYQVRDSEEFSDKWTPLVMPETLLAPTPTEQDRGKVVRDPELSPRDSRDMTGKDPRPATPALPAGLTNAPGASKFGADKNANSSAQSHLQVPRQLRQPGSRKNGKA